MPSHLSPADGAHACSSLEILKQAADQLNNAATPSRCRATAPSLTGTASRRCHSSTWNSRRSSRTGHWSTSGVPCARVARQAGSQGEGRQRRAEEGNAAGEGTPGAEGIAPSCFACDLLLLDEGRNAAEESVGSTLCYTLSCSCSVTPAKVDTVHAASVLILCI